MSMSDYARTEKTALGKQLVLTDMKCFAADLTEELGGHYHATSVPEMAILTEAEYKEAVEEYGKVNSVSMYGCGNTSVSNFNTNLEAASIFNADVNDPTVIGEEVMHGLRHFNYRGKSTTEVDEFYGWLGRVGAFVLLKDRKGYKHMKFSGLIRDLYSKRKADIAADKKNDETVKRIAKEVDELESDIKKMEESDSKVICYNTYSEFASEVFDAFRHGKFKPRARKLEKEHDKDLAYIRGLKVDKCVKAELRKELDDYAELLRKGDKNGIHELFERLFEKEEGFEKKVRYYKKKKDRRHELNTKRSERIIERYALESSVNHAIGYSIAAIAYPVAKDDKSLLKRTEEEVRHIYFDPTEGKDWSRHSANNPIWKNARQKALREMEKRMREVDAAKAVQETIILGYAGMF